MISNGSASAAMIINSEMPLFSVFVASLAPFLSCLYLEETCTMSKIVFVSAASASGNAFGFGIDVYEERNAVDSALTIR